MIITSKLLFGTLVVLIGLFIFVRGLWLSNQHPLSWLDFFNWFIVVVTCIIALYFYVLKIGCIALDYLKSLWLGRKELFKPFTINFKRKKHD